MSLIIHDVEQGSEEWHQLRVGIPTSTTISAMLTPTGKIADNQTSRTAVNELVAERLTNRPPDPIFSRDLERGQLDEPLARETYEQHTGKTVDEVGFMTNEFEGRTIGFSPDGLVDDDGLTEFKSRKPRLQLQYVLNGQIPFAHFIQMHTGMLISGRDWCDYGSYSGGLPMHIQRVYKDETWQRRIIAALVELEKRAATDIFSFQELTQGMPPTEYVDHFPDLEIKF